MATGRVLPTAERDAGLSEISEAQLGPLRLRTPELLSPLERSLRRHGQLEPIIAFVAGEWLEVIDGFKRLDVARQLGWPRLRVRVCELELVEAKLLLPELHSRRSLSALEEAWLIRSLHRDDGLSQGRIAERLSKHKSWVCRRLLLAEQITAEVQALVRLGLIAPRAAMALAALPRGNQKAVADIVAARGLTVRQTELLVADVLECNSSAQLGQQLHQWKEGARAIPGCSKRSSVALRSEADWLCHDITTLRAIAARLQARLLGTPLQSLGDGPASIICAGLAGLARVLGALRTTVDTVLSDNAASATASSNSRDEATWPPG